MCHSAYWKPRPASLFVRFCHRFSLKIDFRIFPTHREIAERFEWNRIRVDLGWAFDEQIFVAKRLVNFRDVFQRRGHVGFLHRFLNASAVYWRGVILGMTGNELLGTFVSLVLSQLRHPRFQVADWCTRGLSKHLLKCLTRRGRKLLR